MTEPLYTAGDFADKAQEGATQYRGHWRQMNFEERKLALLEIQALSNLSIAMALVDSTKIGGAFNK